MVRQSGPLGALSKEKTMKPRTKLMIAAFAAVSATMAGDAPVAAAGCGVPPIPPIGCKKVQMQCQCNAQGQQCHYAAVCVQK